MTMHFPRNIRPPICIYACSYACVVWTIQRTRTYSHIISVRAYSSQHTDRIPSYMNRNNVVCCTPAAALCCGNFQLKPCCIARKKAPVRLVHILLLLFPIFTWLCRCMASLFVIFSLLSTVLDLNALARSIWHRSGAMHAADFNFKHWTQQLDAFAFHRKLK